MEKRFQKKSLQGLLPGRETPDFFSVTALEHDESWRCVHVDVREVGEVRDKCGFAYAGQGQIMNLSQISGHGRKNPHVTKEIEQLIKEKRYAYRRFKKNPSPELRLQFTTIRNKVTARIRKAERAYASTLHRQAQLSPSKSTSRDFWHFVRNLTGKSQRKPPSLLIDPLSQQTFSTPESKANLLNRFFC